MDRRGRRKGSQGGAEGRVRGRVRERVQGRPKQSAGRRRGTFDVDAVAGYANRLRDEIEDNPELAAGAASGLAGAASGLAGSSLAGGSGEPEEDFRNEVRERLDLIDQRLQRLEDEMRLESGPGDTTEPGPAPDPEGNL